MARENDVNSVQPDTINVGNGTSLFISVLPWPGQVGIILTYKGAGGTLEIAGGGPSLAASGSVNGVAPTLVANGTGYAIPAASSITLNGPAAFWLSSGGVTTTVSALRLLKRNEI